MRGSGEDKNHNPVLLELSLLNSFHKRRFSCHVFCLLYTIGFWGAFLASSDFLVLVILTCTRSEPKAQRHSKSYLSIISKDKGLTIEVQNNLRHISEITICSLFKTLQINNVLQKDLMSFGPTIRTCSFNNLFCPAVGLTSKVLYSYM